MSASKTNILIVEDEYLLAQLYITSLEDLEFKQLSSFEYQFNNVHVHFASSIDDATDRVTKFSYVAVFLDHNVGLGQTSESVVPEIFRNTPDCQLLLASSDLVKQTDAVTKALTDAGLSQHIAGIKTHSKNDTKNFERVINDIIGPSGAAAGVTPPVVPNP